MKSLPILAAVILAATAAQVRAQDDLDSLSKAAATPTPAPAGAAKSTPAQVQQPRGAVTTTAAPKSTPAPTAPHESVREQLAHGHFVQAGDLASMVGAKVPANTFLVGTFKASGNKAGGRTEFDGSGGVHVFVRFPVAPDPKLTAQGYSSKWEKAAPLRVERIENTPRGLTAWAVDVTP